MPQLEYQVIDDVTTTDSYVRNKVGVVPYLSSSITIKNTGGSNAVHWKVEGANTPDFADAVELKAEASLGAGLVGSHEETQAWGYISVSIKAAVGGNQTTVDSWISGR